MSGSEGEISKIDLTDGNDIIRILLTDERKWKKDERREVESVVMKVGRSTEKQTDRPHGNPFSNMCHNLWNSKLEILEQRTFYQINRDEDFFTEDYAEYCSMQDVQLKRLLNRDDRRWSPKTTELGEGAKQAAVRYIKRKLGKSRVSSKDIKVTKKEWQDETRYYVKYFSNEYRLA